MVNGDQVRHVSFRFGGCGYGAAQVDDLLQSTAVELDAGRPVAPLIGVRRRAMRAIL
jgi:hypothetical protein